MLNVAGQHFSQSTALSRNTQWNISVLEGFGTKEAYETQVASNSLFQHTQSCYLQDESLEM